MEKTQGTSINGEDDHWVVNCPNCDKELEYLGFYDEEDLTKCSCGCKFQTERVWINDDTYIGNKTLEVSADSSHD